MTITSHFRANRGGGAAKIKLNSALRIAQIAVYFMQCVRGVEFLGR